MKTERLPLRTATLAACALVLTSAGMAQSPGPAATKSTTPKTALLVLSKQNHTLAIVDPADLRVVAKVPVGEDPHEVVASTDGRTAYVSNYGFGRFNTISVVDLVGQEAEPRIDLGALRGPHGLAFVKGKLWFTAEVAKAIGSYDALSGKVDWIMGTGQNRTHMLYVFPDAKKIVTTNVNSGTVLILEKLEAPGGAPRPGTPPPPGLPQGAILPPGGDWMLTVIPVGSRDEGFDVSPGHREAWVANAGDGTISVIDIDAKRVVATLNADVKSANRLKFTPDGKHVLVSMLGGPDLVVLDVATRKVIKRVQIGHGAAGIQMQPDGKRAFVACTPDNYVAVIDLNTLSMVGKIDAGGGPDGMAWAVEK